MTDSKRTLDSFLTTFLKPQNNKRKYTGNELYFIQSTLNGIFKKYLGVELSYADIIEAFDRLDYCCFKITGVNNTIKTIGYSSPKGLEYYVNDTYFNVSASEVRLLHKTLKRLPANTKENKIKEQKSLINRLEIFFEKQ